jgi:hypothetical protein
MGDNMYLPVFCLVITLYCFYKAYKFKANRNMQNSYLNQKYISVSETGEVYTLFRKYKSMEGLIRHQYKIYTMHGILILLFGIIIFLGNFFKIDIGPEFNIFMLLSIILTDYIYYRKCMNA